LVEGRTRDTDIAGSSTPYFFLISSKVWFMLLKQELRRKAGISINWPLVKTFDNKFFTLRGLEPLPVGENLKIALIQMYWIITDIGMLFHH